MAEKEQVLRRSRDPFQAFRFAVHLDGIESTVFMECRGLEVSTEVEEYKEGGQNAFIHKLAGRTKYGNVTLQRGWTEDQELWRKWYKQVIEGTGEFQRKNVSIIQYGPDATVKCRWNLRRAFPVKWTGPNFKADTSAVSIEALELVHEGFELE